MRITTNRLFTAAQVRELDRLAIEEMHIPGIELMERAGRAAYGYLQEHWPEAKRIAVFCGVGNNGGDGYVVARLAAADCYAVDVFLMGNVEKVEGAARTALERMQAQGTQLSIASPANLSQYDLIVDGLLGTGLSGEVRGDIATTIESINATVCPVLALDIPSGLCADTGAILGKAVKADATVTFIAMKQGLLTGQAPNHVGDCIVDDLEVPGEVFPRVTPSANRLELKKLLTRLPARAATAHKGDFGHLLVVGGMPGYSGAARLCAEAALRCGTGLVSIATHPAHAACLNAGRPELMVHAIKKASQLHELIERATVIAVGPGLGQTRWSKSLFEIVIQQQKPMLVDADALNLLSRRVRNIPNAIMTPHPGEAARLLAITSQQVQANRFDAINHLVEQYSATVVLKGAGTLVSSPGQGISVCTAGNPGMATGGMGDVLTGVIAALLAQGMDASQAAQLGVCIHASAADRASSVDGPRGLLASDLLPHLRKLLNTARQDG